MTNKTKAFSYVNSKEVFSNTYLVNFSMLDIYTILPSGEEAYLTPFIFYNEENDDFYNIDIIKIEDNEKISIQSKYTKVNGEQLENVKQDIENNDLVELNKCVNTNTKISSSEMLDSLLDKISNSIAQNPSTPMSTFMIESIVNKSNEVYDKQNELDNIKDKLKQTEKQQKEINLITLSMQNELFLK